MHERVKFRLENSEINEIEITYSMEFNCTKNDRYYYSVSNSFKIDLVNNKIIPNNGKDLHDKVDCEMCRKSYKNVLRKEIDLTEEELTSFLNEFRKLKFDSIKDYLVMYDQPFRNHILISYSSGEYGHHSLYNNPEGWLYLGGMLHNLVGFDILNLETSRYLITPLYYEFKQDGVYDKETSKKLKLKSLKYNLGRSIVLPHIKVDFENKKIDGEAATDETLNLILDLLEKYHIYELEDLKCWQKAMNHRKRVLHGWGWNLHLTFDDGKHFVVGMRNNYPDIFVHLGEEVMELTGRDIIGLYVIKDNEYKVYKAYGNKVLNLR